MIIHTATDVRTWAQNQGGLTEADVRTLVDAIYNDGDGQRPAWGRDWSEYLDRIDIAQSVLEGDVVFTRKRTTIKWNQGQLGNAWVSDGTEGFWAMFPSGTSAKVVLDEYMSTADYSGATGTFTVRAEIGGDVASVRVGPGGEVLDRSKP